MEKVFCLAKKKMILHVPFLHIRGISDFYVLQKSPKISEWISNSSHGTCMGKIVKIIDCEDDVKYQIEK